MDGRHKVAYICDRKRKCRSSKSCGTYCKHTLQPEHAKYGICVAPTLSPRFEKIDNGVYQERENKR